MKKSLWVRWTLLCLIIFVRGTDTWASHMWGGDVTYKCLGSNQFQITLTLYQDCLSGEPQAIIQDDPAQYAIYTSGTTPLLYSSGSVPSATTEIVAPNFSNQCINNYPQTCLRRQIFIFNVTLAPNQNGYDIVYQRCCRNATINNIVNPGNIGVTYSAHIPGFNNGVCPNNSAVFKNLPPQIICAENPLVYDFSATDADGDSLTYELCSASQGGTIQNPVPQGSQITPPPYPDVVYVAPFSSTYPMAAAPPLQIDPSTGLMTAEPLTVGRYIVTVCCHEWRNGQLINTLKRDVQFLVTGCSKTVVADIPQLSDYVNTFKTQCESYTVDFINNSSGGFSYLWYFGIPGATSTQFEPSFTYPDTGTYTVKLVVNPGSTCRDSIERLVRIYPYFNADFDFSGQLCPGSPLSFSDSTKTTFGYITDRLWLFGDGDSSLTQNPVHTYAGTGGDYPVQLVAKSNLGCVDTATKHVVIPYFNPFAGNDTIIVLGYNFEMQGNGGTQYQWTPPDYLEDPTDPNTATHFPATGTYTYVLTVNNKENCTGTDTVQIKVVNNPLFVMPNAFSPNGDGLNDVLKPITIGFSSIQNFKIFNRWGQVVFISDDASKGWDGTFKGNPVEQGVYFWTVKGISPQGNDVEMKGDVTLIR